MYFCFIQYGGKVVIFLKPVRDKIWSLSLFVDKVKNHIQILSHIFLWNLSILMVTVPRISVKPHDQKFQVFEIRSISQACFDFNILNLTIWLFYQFTRKNINVCIHHKYLPQILHSSSYGRYYITSPDRRGFRSYLFLCCLPHSGHITVSSNNWNTDKTDVTQGAACEKYSSLKNKYSLDFTRKIIFSGDLSSFLLSTWMLLHSMLIEILFA
jgi:hypothetical protein